MEPVWPVLALRESPRLAHPPRRRVSTDRGGRTATTHPVVLRVYHSAVVGAWRARDRSLRQAGADVTLVSSRHWNEGGRVVALDPGDDDFVVGARTWGSHPNLFLYDPRPIWRAMRRRAPDIVDVHEEPCSLAATELRLLRRLLCPSASLVLYSAQNILKRYPWPVRVLERANLRAASGVYACNEGAVTILRRKGFTGVADVLPLGVDVERFAPSPEGPPAGGDGLRLGFIGRLERFKGVHVILEAMRHEPRWHLEVVGDGPLRSTLSSDVRRAGMQARVTFRGFVAHDDLPGLYRSFDVLVVPSLPTPQWEEQFCRVAVEAMASAVPVVASASGALPEVVGRGGVLFPHGDAAALRAALQRLDEDPDRRAALGRQAREWSTRFSWEAIARGHRALYEAVVS